jgi:(S)-citramalyl-CoA lyase
MRDPIVCRSMLITCALFPRRYERGEIVGADITMLDLEDSVPPERKDEARRLALPFLAAGRRGHGLLGVRISCLRSPDGLRDILALVESGARPDLVMLTKVDTAEEVRITADLLCGALPALGFVVLIETARGLCAVEEIAAASSRVQALVYGAADLSTDLGTGMSWEAMFYGRARTAAAGAGARVAVMDSPCFEIGDDASLAFQIEKTRLLGFAGKCAVHPDQIEAINRGYSPPAAAVERARKIVARSESAGGQICVVDGDMIGPPHVTAARRLLALADKAEKAEKAERAEKLHA